MEGAMEQQEFFPGNRIDRPRINCSDERHDVFVAQLFLNGFNATEAAKTAGFSAKTARAQGSRLLTNAYIQQQIALKRAELRDKENYSVERVMVELGRIATSDVRELYDAKGKRLPLHVLDDHAAAAVASYEYNDEGVLDKVRFHDKNAALAQLARIHGMNRDKVEHGGKVTLEQLLLGEHDASV